MKKFSLLMMVLYCVAFTSCDEDIKFGPTPDNPPISSTHKFACTKWVADSILESNNNIVSIEFLYNKFCYILTQYDPEKGCNVSKFGHLDINKNTYNFIEDSIIGVFNGYDIIINSYPLKMDADYIAPKSDNNLIGHWEGNYMNIDNGQIIILNIIDNERLIVTNNFENNISSRILSNYSYNDSTITFHNKTYQRKDNEIFTELGTYKYIQ